MDFEKIINERFSVRNFKPEHLPQSVTDKILQAAIKAPTGCNYQPQRILVINTDESITKLRECTKCHFYAPTAMLVCYNKNESWKRPYDGELSAPVDAAITATYIMLAAQNEGVGCCWVMHFNPEKIIKAFNIPENIYPAALMVMGYSADDAKPLDLHFKSKAAEEIVKYENF